MSCRHRVLAELLEQGTRSTLVLPIHKPASSITNLSQSQQTIRAATGAEYDIRFLGINPNHALQHPGFYYYVAARCTEIRRSRFLAALEAEVISLLSLPPGHNNDTGWITAKSETHRNFSWVYEREEGWTPGHYQWGNSDIISFSSMFDQPLQLYTKAYELFKKHSPTSNQGQGRLTLWIAYRIAQTYYEAGKFDMAVRSVKTVRRVRFYQLNPILRFFERIAKTYRREKWNSMLRPLLATWYACAQQLGDVELSIKLLIEMLGHGKSWLRLLNVDLISLHFRCGWFWWPQLVRRGSNCRLEGWLIKSLFEIISWRSLILEHRACLARPGAGCWS